MQDLRLIGVHEDGGHLLLADEDGSRFRVALDDVLRTAVRAHRPHHGQLPLDVEAAPPREVQALIRAGLTAAEVAERCGWPLEKVHKYEVPILAEREYVAGLARLVRLRPRGSSSQPSPTLAGRVVDRLSARGVDRDEVGWDAWREAGSEWTVVLTFPAGGRQRQATWGFDPSTNAIHPRDDEARWFSEDDTSAAAEVVVREVPVYDVEAEGGVGAEPGPERTDGASDPLDLVTAMRQRTNARSRRGSRRRPAEDASLPLEQVAPEAIAPEQVSNGLLEELAEPHAEAELSLLDPLVDPPTAEPNVQPEGVVDHANVTDSASEVSTGELEMEPPARSNRRPARVPVPSWEDVVLGTRPSAD